MKLDLRDIVGLLTGVEDWFTMDHEARFAEYEAKIATIIDELKGAPHILETKKVETPRHPGVTLHVAFDIAPLGKSLEDVINALYDGNPRIRVREENANTLNVCVHTLKDGEDRIVARKLRQVLANGR